MARTKVFDASALLTFLENGTGAHLIHDLFIKAEKKKVRNLISSINLAEVWVAIAKAKSHEKADRVVKELRNMPFEIVEVDWTLSQIAAQLSSKSGIPVVRCIAPALARVKRADLVTGNSSLKPLEELIKIVWLSE